jgi:fructose-specific phosphotransferase system IIA component
VGITEYLKEELILLDVNMPDKNSAIAKTVENMARREVLTDPSSFLEEVLKREQLGSTAIGDGVAIPHARTQNVSDIVVAITRLAKPVNFSPEKELVELIFLIGTPLNAIGEYLKVLARFSKLLRNANVRSSLLSAKTPIELINVFNELE